jgi:hypothetical protein
MDKITQSLVDEFLDNQELTHLGQADAFERFVNFAIVSSEHSDSFDVEEISSPDTEVGIDGIAVLVNGVLITEPDEVEGLAEQNGFIDANFIFLQAKRSSSFSESAIGTFSFAVGDFFSEDPSLPDTEFLRHYLSIKEAVYLQSPKFSKGLPKLQLYYATTGKWNGDHVVESRIKTERASLEGLELFARASIEPVGAKKLQDLYYRTKNPVENEFTFSQRVTLPEIAGVSESYLGVVPAAEYLTLITDDSGQVRKSLFYDNVRDYQGDNPVNQNIADTLQSDVRQRFPVLNNGVTIVARELRTIGDKLFIKDYQVVNGGQTSHVLFNEREEIDESVFVPLKVIGTDNDDLTTAIITATNNQTQIKAEELNARAEFERALEQFFGTYDAHKRLFYERRSKQYEDQADVERVRIITRQQLVRSFASMYLGEPHRATGYVPQLMQQLGSGVFSDQHQIDPYYTAAYAYYKLEFFWRNGQLDRSAKPGRWQILMAIRYLASEGELQAVGAKKVVEEANGLAKLLWDDKKALALFKKAISIVGDATGGVWERDHMRNQPTTRDVQKALEEAAQA